MKIAIYYSGCLRTLKYTIKNTIKTIKKSIDNCEIYTFYSLWDSTDKPIDIPDHWCVPVVDAIGVDRFENNPALEKVSSNYFFPIVSEDNIKKWLIDAGSNFVNGEIEPFSISKELINKSNFVNIPKLISQYYKIYKVAQKFDPNKYDLCLRIRPDVTINNFPKLECVSSLNSFLFINKFMWPGAHSSLNNCNEMVWCSTPDIFLDTCSAYLTQSKNIFTDYSGESVTARHFSSIITNKIVSNYTFFDFEHITFKFSKNE